MSLIKARQMIEDEKKAVNKMFRLDTTYNLYEFEMIITAQFSWAIIIIIIFCTI